MSTTEHELSNHDEFSRSTSRTGSESDSSGFFGRDSSEYLSPTERKAAKAKQITAEIALRQAQVGGGKSITFWGGIAYLINNVCGSGMVLFPTVFQESGWLVVIGGLVAIMILVASCGFMLIEAMAMMPGNKRFQKRVEYTSLTKHYLPTKLYWCSQFFFQMSLLTNNISMIIQSCQVMDFTIAEIFGHSCAIPQFYPQFGFSCLPPVIGGNTVFGDMYLVPLGWLITLTITVPLGFVNLDDNIFVQKGGFITVLAIILIWIVLFVSRGLDVSRVPAIGGQFNQVLGVVVFNFAMITSLPSWVNEKRESVSIVKTFAVGLPLAGGIFAVLGIFGGLAFDKFENNQTILTAVYGLGTKISMLTFFLFPVVVNLISIPVFSILQRYNLVESGVCGHKMALFIAVLCPWLISVPLYTGSGYQTLVTWSGILITSVVNFVVPPILYLLAIRETKSNSERRASIRMNTSLRQSGLQLTPASGLMHRASVNSDGDGLTTNSLSHRPHLEKQESASLGLPQHLSSIALDHTVDMPISHGTHPRTHRMHTNLRQSGLQFAPASGPTHKSILKGDRGLAINARIINEQKLDNQGGVNFGVHYDLAVDIPGQVTLPSDSVGHAVSDEVGPPPNLRPLRSTSVHRVRVDGSERHPERDRKEKVKRAEKAVKKKRAKESMQPTEPDLPQVPIVPTLPWVIPHPWYERILWLCMLPLSISFHYTIPHPISFPSPVGGSNPSKWVRYKLWLWVSTSFMTSLGWLIGLCFMVVWTCALVAQGTTLPPFLLGMFVIGVSTRVPAFIIEYLGYRSGTGDLNRIFLHNVLLILICIPFPWFIYHGVHGGDPVALFSGEISVLCLTLFIMGALVVIVYRSYDWVGKKSVVYLLMGMLIFFSIETWLLEYSILLHLNDDQCIQLSDQTHQYLHP